MPCFFPAHRRRRDVWRPAAVPILASGRGSHQKAGHTERYRPDFRCPSLATKGPSTHEETVLSRTKKHERLQSRIRELTTGKPPLTRKAPYKASVRSRGLDGARRA